MHDNHWNQIQQTIFINCCSLICNYETRFKQKEMNVQLEYQCQHYEQAFDYSLQAYKPCYLRLRALRLSSISV